jgi:hypothetical protein
VELTQDTLDRYEGGQLEIHDPRRGYLSRGEIDGISLNGADVRITFTWRAERRGYPQASGHWANDTELSYTVSLSDFSYSEIGLRRVCLSSQTPDDAVTLTFYMQGEPGLDPAEVDGLELTVKR